MKNEREWWRLLTNIRNILGKDVRNPVELQSPSLITFCSCPGLIEYIVELSISTENYEMHKDKIRKEILCFAEKEGLELVVTRKKHFRDNFWPTLYVDPFKTKEDGKYVFKGVPEEGLNIAYVHFLTPKNMEIFEEIQKRL